MSSKRLVGLMIPATLLLISTLTLCAADFSTWGRRMKVTFSGYPGGRTTLTNFPALVVLRDGSNAVDFTEFETAAGDLRFADETQATELNYEIETWDDGSGSSWIWVQVPELTNDTVIYAYWLKSGASTPAYTTNGATWSNGHAGVWHMTEPDALDSTADQDNGEANNNTNATGFIAGGQGFDGSGDFINVPLDASSRLRISGNKLTQSAWVNAYGNVNNGTIATRIRCYYFQRDDNQKIAAYQYGTSPEGYHYSDDIVPLNEWHHVAYVYDGSSLQFYLDGKPSGSVTKSGNVKTTTSDPLELGGQGNSNTRYFNGLIDEIRLSDVARSPDWMWASWMNQASNSVFAVQGTAAPQTGCAVDTRDPDSVTATSATLNGYLTSTGQSDTAAFVFWGTTNGGSDRGAWANTNTFATPQQKGPLSTNVSLSSGHEYFYRFAASNSAGFVWADETGYLLTAPVTVYAEPATLSEQRETATFTFVRHYALTGMPLTVNYTNTGSATLNADYELGSFDVTIPAASTSTVVETLTLMDGIAEGDETMGLQVTEGYYLVGSPANATVTITNVIPAVSNMTSAAGTWSDPTIWSDLVVPLAGQYVVVGHDVTLDESTPGLASVALQSGSTITVDGWESSLEAVDITVAGTMTHLAQTVTEPDEFGDWIPQHRIWLKGSNLHVTADGILNADYKGYPPEAGPGRAVRGGGYGRGGGGGYGGHGGDGFHAQKYGPSYGDPADPWQPGSSGGLDVNCGIAGGAIRIQMSGQVTIDGTVSARGQNGLGTHGPASSGGGIAVYCDTFQGAATGLIRADAGRGNYYGGCGGGGRIALHYDPASQAALTEPRPPVRFSTHAWRTSHNGSEFTVKSRMGTLYMPDMTLLADTPTASAVLDDHRFWYTRLTIGDSFTNWSPASLTVSNCVIGFPEGFDLDVGEDLILAGTTAPLTGFDTVRAGLDIEACATNTRYGARLTVGRDFIIGTNSWVTPHTEGYSESIVGIEVGRHFTVAAGGGVDANENGYMPESGNGNGVGAGLNADSGGSYGGLGGGSVTGTVYGLAVLPVEPGSPGGWRSHGGGWTESGKGGGVIYVLAGGILTIDGLLTADGGRGWYYRGPAGSGGAIFLAGKDIQGSGTLQATGGLGQDSRGPGGGGRIAVWYSPTPEEIPPRIEETNTTDLVFSYPYAGFDGDLDVGVEPSVLTYQPQEGTKGFYYVPPPQGTLIMMQ